MLGNELVELLVEARRVLGTPYITINDRAFYVMLAYEAFNTVKNGELAAEDFERHQLAKNIFYIAEVTL